MLVIEEIREEIKKFLESDENVKINYQKLWDIAKAVLSL
jgi:intein/homing endonuclease